MPGQVAVALSGGDPHTAKGRAEKYNWPVHIGHGLMLGVVLAALSLLGLGAVLATAVFAVLVPGTKWLLYTSLGIAKPTQWSAADMMRELVLEGIFAAAVGVAFYTVGLR